MDKNIHTIDELFKSAYQAAGEEPGEMVWDKIVAALDKNDAEKFKRKFIGWKRAAIIIPLLLSSIIIYEAKLISVHQYAAVDVLNNENKSVPVKNSITSANPGITNPQLKRKSDLPSAASDASPVNNNNPSPKLSVKAYNSSSIAAHADNQIFEEAKLLSTNSPKSFHSPYNMADVTSDQYAGFKRYSIEKVGQSNNTLPILQPTNQLLSYSIPAKTPIHINAGINKKWSITFFASNDWAQYHLDNDQPDNMGNVDDEKDEIMKREKHEFSFSAGVSMEKQIGSHLRFGTGISYANTSILIAPQEMYASAQNNEVVYKIVTSSGYGYVKPGTGVTPAPGDSIQSSEAQHNLQVIAMPLTVGYSFEGKRFSITPAAGVFAGYITRASLQTEVTDANRKETVFISRLQGIRKIYTGFIARVDMQYKLRHNLFLSVSPSLKYAFSSITTNNVVKTYPYGIGVSAGIGFTF